MTAARMHYDDGSVPGTPDDGDDDQDERLDDDLTITQQDQEDQS